MLSADILELQISMAILILRIPLLNILVIKREVVKMRKSFILLILLIFAVPVYADTVYKWVDEKGTTHFTDDHSTIPEKYGQQAERRSLPVDPTPMMDEKKTESKTAGIPLSSSVEQERPLLFSGLISNVGYSGRSIVVTGEEKEMIFTVLEDTTIRTDYGKNVSFNELKSGKSVTVEYIKRGDENQARSITVSLLSAGITNEALENPDAPGKRQNAGDIQKSVWENQKAHQRPKLPKK